MSEEYITMDGLSDQITQFLIALDDMGAAVDGALQETAAECAGMIQAEQRRLLATKHPDLVNFVQCHTRTRGKNYVRYSIGYTSAVIKEHFELLIIEFGRPGKSSRCAGEMQKKPYKYKRKDGTEASVIRRKGDFPTSISHIRAGYDIAAGKAADALNNKLADIAASRFTQD